MIYLSANGEVIGQFTEAELPSALAAGRFPADAHFWREGMPAWRPLRELVLPPRPAAFSPESKLKLAQPSGAPVARRPFVPRPRQDAAASAPVAAPAVADAPAPAPASPQARPAGAAVRRTILPRPKQAQERTQALSVPVPVPAQVARPEPVPDVKAVPADPPAPDEPHRTEPLPEEAAPARPGLTPFVPGQKTFTPRAKVVLPPAGPVEAPAPAAPMTDVPPRALRTPPPKAVPAPAPAPVAEEDPPAPPFVAPAPRFMAEQPRPKLGSFLRRAALISALPLVAAGGAAAWWLWPARPPVLQGEVLLPGPDGTPAAVAGAEVFVVAQDELAAQWRSRLESAQGRVAGLGEALDRAKSVHREKELARELAVRISELGDEYNMPDREQLRAESEAARAEEAAALVELEKLTLEVESVSGADAMLAAPEGRPQEVATDETGRFTLPLPPAGEEAGLVAFVLAAPPAGADTQPRGWMVPLDSAAQRTEAVRLSADNLLDLDQIRQIAGLSAP